MALPPCAAWMVQVPTATSVTVVPNTVQTDEVSGEKLTVKPEVAVALSGGGVAPKTWGGGVTKVMVWAPGVTRKLCGTGGAWA